MKSSHEEKFAHNIRSFEEHTFVVDSGSDIEDLVDALNKARTIATAHGMTALSSDRDWATVVVGSGYVTIKMQVEEVEVPF